jgi:hypothetical protein
MAVADLWLTSRYASIPAIPAPVHSDDEVREWFASVVLPSRELWVIEANEGLLALLVLEQNEFVVLEPTDGAHEEGAPDVHCHWPSTRSCRSALR